MKDRLIQTQASARNNWAALYDVIYVSSPNLAVERVAGRVASGGHSILEDTIRQQYERGRKNLMEYACCARSTTPFHFGETITPDVANYGSEKIYSEVFPGKVLEQLHPLIATMLPMHLAYAICMETFGNGV
jgi:predicted ABC-type ATPase